MTIEQVGPTGRGGGLAGPLAARGRAVAVISDDTTLTYTDLALRVSARAAEYPAVASGRRMIGLVAGNTCDFLVDYLEGISRISSRPVSSCGRRGHGRY